MKQRLFFSKINQENILTLEDKLINTSSICIINKDYDVKCLRMLNELLVKYSEIVVLYEIETKKLLEEGDLSGFLNKSKYAGSTAPSSQKMIKTFFVSDSRLSSVLISQGSIFFNVLFI